MTDAIFKTAIAAMAEKIQTLEFQLEQAEKENRDLRSQVNDMYIQIHIGKENRE